MKGNKMVSLKTGYLGLPLEHPFICGSSPFGRDLDSVKRIEDGGAAAIVFPSLFEEQILREQKGLAVELDKYNESFSEAVTFFPPSTDDLRVGPQSYLEMIRKAKKAVNIPVIASLNGRSEGGWTSYAAMIEEAGADAIELNIYDTPLDTLSPGYKPEKKIMNIVKAITGQVKIPLAVKLYQQYSLLARFCWTLTNECGAKGVVLFNRFMEADIDIKDFEVVTRPSISSEAELLDRLVWTSVIRSSAYKDTSIAISGGVHSPEAGVKAVLAGADAVQLVSAVMLKGPQIFGEMRDFMKNYMEEKEYNDFSEMRGVMSYEKSPNAAAYQRLNYLRLMMAYNY